MSALDNTTKIRRVMLRKLQETISQQYGDDYFKRQVEIEDDPFRAAYRASRLRKPVYDFARLYNLYEESDVLQSCIEAMQQNVDGFGYQLDFLGDDVLQRKSLEATQQYETAKNFFDQVNENESLSTIRRNLREDLEVLGNAGIEIIRTRNNRIAMLYHIPFSYIRLSLLEKKFQTIKVPIRRDGKVINIRIKKKFRKFAQLNQYETEMRWFKEFGDKRIMDATTGEYKSSLSECKLVASEILHFKLNFGGAAYGLPRWIGALFDVMGRRSAQYVNWDLFNSQGIPPMAVMVSGGVLSDDSVDELESMIRGMRGVERWNRIALFESNPETVGLETKGSAKIEMKNLNEYRKDDQMFSKYLESSKSNIRHRFRLPPLYVGSADTFTNATAKSARAVAEEQVFSPERIIFDEVINSKLMVPELGIDMWSYRSLGPKISNPEEISKGVETFARAGAFSVNHAIERANEAFGLQMSTYDAAWASYPLGLVMKSLELGTLNLEGLSDNDIQTIDTGGRPRQGIPDELRGGTGSKILKSDSFSDKEKKLYKQLLLIQSVVDTPDNNEVIDL